MNKYIFTEYRDKKGTGSNKFFDTETDAVAYAKKEWGALCEADRKTYFNDSFAWFRVDVGEVDDDGCYGDADTVWDALEETNA